MGHEIMPPPVRMAFRVASGIIAYLGINSIGELRTRAQTAVCALGHQSLVCVLTRCGLPLPVYVLADEKHSYCLTEKVYLLTIVRGRVIWHVGYAEEASAAALTQSYGEFQRAASPQEPSYRVWGILSDGFDSTAKSRQTLFPGVRLGNCRRHAINKLPKQLAAIASPIRKALCSQFHTWLYQARQRKGLRVEGFNQGEFQPSSDVSVLPPIILPPLDRYAHLRERVERCRSVPSASVIGSSITAPLPASPRSFVGGVASSLPAPLHAGSHSR
jgi:hypothetical protein